MNKKTLETILSSVLMPMDFKKKGSTWYRQVNGVLQVIDLQKSNYGEQFFVNICFVPEGMIVEGMPTPKEHKCPIRIRLTSAFPDICEKINMLLDLEHQHLTDSERDESIRAVFSSIVFPFLFQLQTNNSLKQAIEQGIFKHGAVNLAVKKQMGVRE